MDDFIPILTILTLFIGLPWLIFHYVTKWKQAATITLEDENLLDELHDIARRLDDRMTTIERIIAVDRDKMIVTDLHADHRPALGTEPGFNPTPGTTRHTRES